MTAAPTMETTIETARLVLRPREARDLPRWTAFYMSDRARFVRSGAPTEALAWRGFAAQVGHWTLRGYGSFVFALKEAPGEALGAAGPWFPEGWPEPEIGWTLWSVGAEGAGYAAEAAAAGRDHAFRDLGWDTAVSYVDARNTRSIRLAERLGAAPDWDAATPDGEQCVVFRHPRPEAIS